MKLRTGIALHQWPRLKVYRKEIVPPDGYVLAEFDFSGQEMRWMAEYSRDETMLNLFSSAPPYDDAHGFMGSRLTNRTFEDLLACRKLPDEDPRKKQADNDRYLGKFANLSLQYRTSAKKLMSKARIEYKIPMLLLEANQVRATYLQTFAGVPAYWDTQIQFAKMHGYVETFAGKRYRFSEDAWMRDRAWGSESTAINFPIQGVGGSQKALAMAHLVPYLWKNGGMFGWDLHDGLFNYLPEKHAVEQAYEIREMLSNLPYEKAWGFKPTIPFPVDCKLGSSWGDLQELK